jgi:ABC-type branched-subunit amino acid transport system ATPase component
VECHRNLDFAKRLADSFIVLDRGRVVHAGDRKVLEKTDVRALLTV